MQEKNFFNSLKVVKNALWLGIGFIMSVGVTALMNALIARLAGPEVYGNYVLAVTFLGFLAVVTDFGISTYAIRELSKSTGHVDELKGNVLVVKLILGALGFFIFWIIISFSSYGALEETLLVFGSSIIVIAFLEYARIVLRAQENMKCEALVRSVERIAFLGFGVSTLVFFKSEYTILTLGLSYLAAQITAALTAWKLFDVLRIRIYDFAYSNKAIMRMLFSGAPFFISGLAWQGYTRLDRLILEKYDNSSAVGFYAAAYVIISLVESAPSLYFQAIFPRMSSLYGTCNAGFYKTIWRGIILSIFVAMILSSIVYIFSNFIISLIYGSQYSESVTALRIMCWSLIFSIPMNLLAYAFPAINIAKPLIKAAVIGAVISVVLNLYLIPIYSIVGVSIVLVATQCMVFSYATYMFSRTKKRLNK